MIRFLDVSVRCYRKLLFDNNEIVLQEMQEEYLFFLHLEEER